jgi:hypothetical protein
MSFEMRARALALLDGLEDDKIPQALEYLRGLAEETSQDRGLEDLLEERA